MSTAGLDCDSTVINTVNEAVCIINTPAIPVLSFERFRLSNILHGGLKDPRIHPMTSVVKVDVASDLKTAKAYISVLGSDEDARLTMEGLKSSAGFIRHSLAKNLNLRNTPEIEYILDDSIAYGVRMTKLIDEVVGTDGISHPSTPEEDETYDD